MSTTAPDVLAVFDLSELVDELIRRDTTLLAALPTASLIGEIKRRGASEDEWSRSVVNLPGLTVDPVHSRAVYRGVAYQVGGRAMEVLYALAVLRRRGVVRLRSERLAAKIWRGYDRGRASACLRSSVYELNKAIPGLIDSRRNGLGYALNLDLDDMSPSDKQKESAA